MKASLKLNGVIFEVEATKFKDVIRALSLVQGTPVKCDNCDKGAKLLFHHRSVKRQSDGKMCDYYGVVCTGCGGTKNLHFRQNEAQTPYWKWDEGFRDKATAQAAGAGAGASPAPATNDSPPPPPPPAAESEDEIPF